MGQYVSKLLLCPCFGREEKKDIETDYITPITTQPDIVRETSNLDYTTDDMYKDRNSLYGTTTYDGLEYGTRIKYYVLNNGKRIDMI